MSRIVAGAERRHRLAERADEVLRAVGHVRRAEQDALQRPDGPDPDPRPARQGRRRRGHPPVRAAAGRLLGAGQRRADHQHVGPGGDRLGQLATATHPAVGDDRDVAAGLGEERVARRGHVADRGDLRDADAEDLAGRAGGPGPDADEDRRGALLHERERGLRVGRVADRDRDRHVAGERLERQRVVLGREVAGRRHLALDEEQVRAVLGAERPEAARGGGRRGDRGLRTRGMDLIEPPRDELLADRLLVGLGEERPEVGVVGRRDPLEDRVGVVVARLDALEVQDGEPAEPGERAGHPRVHDRVHRRGEDRDREVDAAEGLGQIDIGRLDGVGAGSERDVLEAVGRADRVHLGVEDPSTRRLTRVADLECLGSVDHLTLRSRRR